MITYNTKKTITRFTDTQGTIFEVTATFCPNEENDKWVEYYNTKTGQEYSCRMEAFLARFHPLHD